MSYLQASQKVTHVSAQQYRTLQKDPGRKVGALFLDRKSAVTFERYKSTALRGA